MGKPVSKAPSAPKPKPVDYMPRFDPDADVDIAIDDNQEEDEAEKARTDSNEEPAKDENSETPGQRSDTTNKLKLAFGGGQGFSFGFRGSEPGAEDKKAPKPAAAVAKSKNLFRLEDDDEAGTMTADAAKPAAADFSQKFGAQLKTKSDGEGVEPFFFGADDSRVVAALDFFFTDRPDLDKIREEFSARGRSELSLIFKRKARAKAQLLRPAKSKKHLGRFGGKRRMNTRGGGGGGGGRGRGGGGGFNKR